MTRNKAVILAVDDAPETLDVLRRTLGASGHRVFTAPGAAQAIEILHENTVDLLITDLKMPKISGLDLVRHVRENLEDIEVIMITGYATINGAVEAVKTGAEEYLAKPFTDDELHAAVDRAMMKLEARRSAKFKPGESLSPKHGIIGQSAAMQEVFEAISKAAATSATVLISGESGTGKELVARAIHYKSTRASAPFLPINCGAIPGELVESELFGHIKGAFTGATDSRAGFFQTADGGSIFLDEIGDMSLSAQINLLRVLEDKQVRMVGSSRSSKVDVRILAATNKDIGTLVKKGTFREDLYFRLSVITIALPPLRARGKDVLLLARDFSETVAREFGRSVPTVTDRALQALLSYSWPGNVRELENLLQRLIVMKDTSTIDITDLPEHMRFKIQQGEGLNRTLAEVEMGHIKKVLMSVDGNKSHAAKILGITRKTLREKLKAMGEFPQS
jgi:DNA-binding NtrC family response regulator